jgi:transketolase
VTYVLTHDSIGLGEDGPTHQPVETLAMLRATPGLVTLRPADAVEAAEAWEIALDRRNGPTAVVLSRQDLPVLRGDGGTVNRAAQGGYVLAEAVCGPRRVTLIATGSEVAIAREARASLETAGIGTAVVSMPSFEVFRSQTPAYRETVLGPRDGVRVGIEAALPFGWHEWLGGNGAFVGMTGFGASAPADVLYRHFGITAEAVVARARALIEGTA